MNKKYVFNKITVNKAKKKLFAKIKKSKKFIYLFIK